MQGHGLWCFALLALLYFWIGNSGAAAGGAKAKCAGKWAIHACAAGNGKRSDPNIDQANTERDRGRVRLQDILFNKQLWQNQVRDKTDPEWETMDRNPKSDFEDIPLEERYPQEERKRAMSREKMLLDKLLRILKEVEEVETGR